MKEGKDQQIVSDQKQMLNSTKGYCLSFDQEMMIKEDISALTYQKMNTIITLQLLNQQNQQQRGNILSTLSFDQQMLESQNKKQVLLKVAENMTSYHFGMKKQSELFDQQNEMSSELRKLYIEKKCLIEEFRVFLQTLKEQILKQTNEKSKTLEKLLLQIASKHNIHNVMSNFIGELKSSTATFWLRTLTHQFLRTSKIKSVALDDICSKIKCRTKKELHDSFYLYLREFCAPHLQKEISDLLNQFITAFQSCKNKLREYQSETINSICQNITQLQTKISEKESVAMDLRIELEIILQETNLLQTQIQEAKEIINEVLSTEATQIMENYLQQNKDSFQGSYNFFYKKLFQQWRQFISDYLLRAQKIDSVHKKINFYSSMVQLCTQQLKKKSSRLLKKCHEQNIKQPKCVSKPISLMNSRKILEINDFNETSRFPALKQITQNVNNVTPKFDHKSQKFIVQKSFNIGSQYSAGKIRKKDYELRVTSKCLILQPMEEQVLSVSQKIEVKHIRSCQIDKKKNEIRLDYGGCTSRLKFVTFNLEEFKRKIERLISCRNL